MDRIAKASTIIDAPAAKVWDALVNTERGAQTEVALSQDHNATDEEREHSENNWRMMLDGLKKFVESH